MNPVTGGLATYRLARLLREDAIGEPVRARIIGWAGQLVDEDSGRQVGDEEVRERAAVRESDPGVMPASLWLRMRCPMMVELVGCPWCLSVWAAFALVGLERVAPRTARVVETALAWSTVAGLVADLAD